MNIDAKDLDRMLCNIINKIIDGKSIEASIDIDPEHVGIQVSPWKPYEMKCPYGRGDGDV